ncbi:efflux RND transporter periplasmic adaptor subunit [Roseomonas sp. 18066]|uniref:efflux RND transporter periplasmic adaptor subunit n=1 Tax=Roseomonas sp. 18066 TaxID=2681412 RepID=UPI001358CDD3|nr:efflux RND transporter periplasmic adaptor subunit [Roseomonas sp. 18066]
MPRRRFLPVLLLLAACGETAAPPQAAPPPRVGVVAVQPQPTPLVFDYGGRVTAFRQTEVRARVGGILLQRAYAEGAAVQAGAVLFRIDPATYQAAVDLAAAQLQEAEAGLERARRDQARTAALARASVGTQRDRDDAVSALAQAEAQLAAARARLASARLELGYTTVTAPIAGVTSLEAVPEGSLIGTAEGNSLLTRITQLDPVHVGFAFNAADLAALGGAELPAEVVLDGAVAARGRVSFTEATVDAATGTVRARATFANPDRRLIPGQFVRLRVAGPARPAFRIPQAAVQQDVQGAFAYVVGPDGKAGRRALRLGRMLARDWIVEQGLQPGDRVIAEGLVRVTEGAVVEAVEARP